MFSVIRAGDAVILQSGGGKAEILPQCGGILNRWSVQLNDQAFEVIDGYDSPADFKKNCEDKGFRSCKLSPYVCRMNNSEYEFENRHYTIGKFELAGLVIHGLLYNNPFTVVSSFADEQAAVVVLQHDYDGSDKGYPFTYTIQVSYVLGSNNELGITTVVTNTSDSPIPIADGWHPYFSLGRKIDELKFSMQTDAILEFNDALIPTGVSAPYNFYHQPKLLGTQFFDNCFSLNRPLQGPACRLINEKDNVQLSIYPDKSYPYMQVYTPPHRNSIAIENLSAAPDAFNNHIGLIVLEPKEAHAFSTSFRVEKATM